jgi:hypothetical protein
MTYPDVPLDIVVRLFINNEWIDITSDVRGPSVNIKGRGSDSERSNQNTQSCALSINDRQGKYVDQNPLSIYYDKLGVNTPLKVSVRPHHTTGPLADLLDTFTRTVVDGWSQPDTGQAAYALSGGGGAVLFSDWQVNGGEGKLSVPVANASRQSITVGMDVVDFDSTITFKCPQATGAPLEPINLIIRSDANGIYDSARVEVTTANQVVCKVIDRTGVDVAVVTVPSLTHTGTGQPLKLRTLVLGHEVYMRVWIAANAEPSVWHAVGALIGPPISGNVGVRAGIALGNTNATPVVFAYDNWSLTPEEPRSTTEVAEWPTTWDTTGTDIYVPIVGAGLRRRLSKGQKPLRSAHTRTVLANSILPQAYWPLEDPSGSVSASSGLPSASAMVPKVNTGAPSFGNTGIVLGSAASVSFADGGTLVGAVDDPVVNEWTVEFVITIDAPQAGAASSTLGVLWRTSGTYGTFECLLANNDIRVRHYEGATLRGEAVAGVTAFDKRVRHVRYETEQNGANYLSRLYVDGILEDTADNFGSPMVGSIGAVNSVELNPLNGNGLFMPSAISQVAVWGSPPPSAIASAALGYSGETAADRLVRLGNENGLTVDIRGTASESMKMGPQPTATLLDIMDLTAQTDQGLLYESKHTLGFEYRVRASLYNLTGIALSYTDQLFSDEIKPNTDDRLLVNSVIGKQLSGNEYTYSEETGKRSIQDYPNGAGLYQVPLDFNTQLDSGLVASTQFAVARGIVLERIPSVKVNLARSVFTDDNILTNSILKLDLLSKFTVTDMPAWVPPKDYPVLIQGYSERIDGLGIWEINWNTVPFDPFIVGIWDSDPTSRWDTDNSVTSTAITSGVTTSFTVVTDAPNTRWIAGSGAAFPIPVEIAGVVLNVTAIASTTNTQTFTVDAAPLNGVLKVIPIGSKVRLANPIRYSY